MEEAAAICPLESMRVSSNASFTLSVRPSRLSTQFARTILLIELRGPRDVDACCSKLNISVPITGGQVARHGACDGDGTCNKLVNGDFDRSRFNRINRADGGGSYDIAFVFAGCVYALKAD